MVVEARKSLEGPYRSRDPWHVPKVPDREEVPATPCNETSQTRIILIHYIMQWRNMRKYAVQYTLQTFKKYYYFFYYYIKYYFVISYMTYYLRLPL
jgi:hypothetical protein